MTEINKDELQKIITMLEMMPDIKWVTIEKEDLLSVLRAVKSLNSCIEKLRCIEMAYDQMNDRVKSLWGIERAQYKAEIDRLKQALKEISEADLRAECLDAEKELLSVVEIADEALGGN